MWSPRTEEEYPRKDNLGRGPAPQGGVVDHWLAETFSGLPRSELVCSPQASSKRASAAASCSWGLGRKACRGNLGAGVGGGGSPEGDHQVRMGLQGHQRMHVWGHGWGQVWPDVLRPILLTDCEAAGTSGRSPFLLQCSSSTFY